MTYTTSVYSVNSSWPTGNAAGMPLPWWNPNNAPSHLRGLGAQASPSSLFVRNAKLPAGLSPTPSHENGLSTYHVNDAMLGETNSEQDAASEGTPSCDLTLYKGQVPGQPDLCKGQISWWCTQGGLYSNSSLVATAARWVTGTEDSTAPTILGLTGCLPLNAFLLDICNKARLLSPGPSSQSCPVTTTTTYKGASFAASITFFGGDPTHICPKIQNKLQDAFLHCLNIGSEMEGGLAIFLKYILPIYGVFSISVFFVAFCCIFKESTSDSSNPTQILLANDSPTSPTSPTSPCRLFTERLAKSIAIAGCWPCAIVFGCAASGLAS